MNIYIGEPKTITISDMQWPAPDWFHIPLSSEWQWLRTIMVFWLSFVWWNGWRINLHMPFAGHRGYSNAVIYNQGSYGLYWSSSRGGTDYPNRASGISLNSSNADANYSVQRAEGYSIRCFKNSYVVPDSSWTVITWTLWWAWIFWNQSEWLISITDWTDGYTMMDKNLWATTVYNDWDTLSEANMGNMYQWWNNYWFPSTWTISKTSSTQVNAQNYWPWNYYSSDTFITRSSSPYDWSSIKNDNLRWWETQWSSTKQVPQEVQNIYIGEYKGWKPWSNTLAYYPLNWNLNDYSWNNRNLTWSWVTYTSWWKGQVAVFSSWATAYYQNNSIFNISQPFTYSLWCQTTYVPNSSYGGRYKIAIAIGIQNGTTIATHDKDLWFGKGGIWAYNYYNDLQYCFGWSANINTWYHIVYTQDSSNQKVYLNWTLVWTHSCWWSYTWYTDARLILAKQINDDNRYPFSWSMSEVIMENKARTAEQVLNYYNLTKSNYWL